jgi:uncharacterized protein
VTGAPPGPTPLGMPAPPCEATRRLNVIDSRPGGRRHNARVIERERDPGGRPLNARPRDGLGRPLARGSAGVARVPEGFVLPPEPALAEAQRLLDEGMPFHAHEVLEGTWKAAPAAERDLWQGLAQLAVGLTHVLRGNPAGAATLLRRGRARLAPYAEAPPHGVDVPGLLGWTDELLGRLADPAGAGQAQPPTLRRSAPS